MTVRTIEIEPGEVLVISHPEPSEQDLNYSALLALAKDVLDGEFHPNGTCHGLVEPMHRLTEFMRRVTGWKAPKYEGQPR